MSEPPVNAPTLISGSTAIVGVLGDPVRHSLSPVMQNAALRAMGFDWVFLALPTPAEQLASVVSALEAMGCRGLNVTIPHKHNVARLCRSLSPLAQRVGAVNVLVPLEGGGWHGTNTDVEGFCAPLRRQDSNWAGKRAVVLGCGGSARAVVAGLVELGFASIQLAGRRAEALNRFVSDCQSWAPQLQALSWTPADGFMSALGSALEHADLVVNTTPVGMASASGPEAELACPLSASELASLRGQTTVYDIIYTPRPTQLLRQAAARDCRCIDGVDMLVEQGAAALRLWSGRNDVPVENMRQALLEQLP
ncbi:MAG: shikimate dehydrogenase [Cyanobacteriota bacterium]|nr:shikimate dehydrogenase [Cyanobacteriota bacterium]